MRVLFVTLAALVGLVFFWRSNHRQPEVKGLISPTVEIVPVVSISATPSPTASVSAEMMTATKSAEATVSATPKPTKKVTPKPTPTPIAEAAETVYRLVERFAAQYGVDPNVLRYMALCESGFRSNAVNGPYVGLFQFNAITWKNIREEMGENTDATLRFSAEEAVQTAAYALSKGKGKIWPNCMPQGNNVP